MMQPTTTNGTRPNLFCLTLNAAITETQAKRVSRIAARPPANVAWKVCPSPTTASSPATAMNLLPSAIRYIPSKTSTTGRTNPSTPNTITPTTGASSEAPNSFIEPIRYSGNATKKPTTGNVNARQPATSPLLSKRTAGHRTEPLLADSRVRSTSAYPTPNAPSPVVTIPICQAKASLSSPSAGSTSKSQNKTPPTANDRKCPNQRRKPGVAGAGSPAAYSIQPMASPTAQTVTTVNATPVAPR